MTPPTYAAAVAETARRALIRIVKDAMRQIEEVELEPERRWTWLRNVLDDLSGSREKD